MLLIPINDRFSINNLLVILQIYLPDGDLLDIQQDVTEMVNLLGVVLSMSRKDLRVQHQTFLLGP
jgi:hypothetical protein